MFTKKTFTAIMTALTISGCDTARAAGHPSDTLTTRDGQQLVITFFGHGSLAVGYRGRHIYIDPVGDYADYTALPKADLILVTHAHGDHLDKAAIEALSTEKTEVVSDMTSFEQIGHGWVPGYRSAFEPWEDFPLSVEAVPAYNMSPAQLQFHPREAKMNGYVLTLGGTRLYIAGDTENTPEMKELKGIDIAFLPVNQPYTMTVDQAVDAVKTIRPTIFYPYHYGGTGQKTDIDRLVRELEGVTDVRIRPME